MTLTMGSLFAGVGGIEKSFEDSGFECRWQCEIDPNANVILAKHWPNTKRYLDIREVDGSTIEPVDVITAGFPCQDLSIAGARNGLAGNRSGLFFEITRIVREMQNATSDRSPTFLVLESVPGLYTTHSGRDFAVVLRALAELRPLDIAWRILDAQFFGIPQRRRRVFIVADFRGERAETVLFESQGRGGYFATRAKAKAGVAAPLTSGSHGNGHSAPERDVEEVAHTLTSHHKRLDQESEDFVVAGPLLANQSRGQIKQPYVAVSDASEDGTGRGVPLIPVCPGGKTDASYWKATDTANTVAAGQFPWQGTRVQEQNQTVRRLTPTECEKLQGLPPGWTEGLSDTARYTLIGNSVAIPVLAWIARRMHDALDTTDAG